MISESDIEIVHDDGTVTDKRDGVRRPYDQHVARMAATPYIPPEPEPEPEPEVPFQVIQQAPPPQNHKKTIIISAVCGGAAGLLAYLIPHIRL